MILLVGCGPMAVEYLKVLSDIGSDVTVIGRGDDSARWFEEQTGLSVKGWCRQLGASKQ